LRKKKKKIEMSYWVYTWEMCYSSCHVPLKS